MVRKFSITFSQAVDGFMLEKRAQQRSRHTLISYSNAFRKFVRYLLREFAKDPPLETIKVGHVKAFLAELGTRAVAAEGIAPRQAAPLSKKSIFNVHGALSSLWSWAVREGYAENHIVRRVPRPRPETRAIVPYSRADVKKMLQMSDITREYVRRGKPQCVHARSTALRDRAMMMLLVDTGIRASELCKLRIEDVDLANQRAKIFGKGTKERLIHFGRRAGKAIWRYLVTRPDKRSEDPLFVAMGTINQPVSRTGLSQMIRRLGDRAGVVPKANVHRFRHTFAINFLRNGGDAYSLQAMLGHSSLEMVRRYLAIVQADTENAHRRASPADNWRL